MASQPVNVVMTLRESFAERELLQDYLAWQLRQGRLAFVLGAGVSVPFGLPGWQDLVNRLYTAANDTPPIHEPPERQVEHLRVARYKYDPAGFVGAVRAALYEAVRADRWALHTTKPLSAIATAVMACARHGTANVITFNFDDLLELYLEQHGAETVSITDPRHWAEGAKIRVFHPHGLLPLRPGVPAGAELVLDQQSFARILGDAQSAWRHELRAVLRTHTCVFIGLSGADLHLDTLLTAVAGEHTVLAERIPFWGVRLHKEDPVGEDLWAQRKVATFTIEDWDEALAGFLLDVCEKAATFERRT